MIEPGAGEVQAAWTQCMRGGDFQRAWAISDAVLAARDPSTCDDPSQPYHLRWVWDGSPVDDVHVLVRCYHGLGDTLQFARFLPALRHRAARLTLELQGELLAVFSQLDCIDDLVEFHVARPLASCGCNVEIMELAHVLRAGKADIATNAPYLRAPRTMEPFSEDWRAAIGLCWRAGDWNASRSIDVELLTQACTASGRPFVSLQRGKAACEATDPRFLNPRDEDCRVERTAYLVQHLRTVITVDTMVAHLAGALGKPCMLLLNTEPDWRWPLASGPAPAQSIWYPTTRIFHKHPLEGWATPLAQLGAYL